MSEARRQHPVAALTKVLEIIRSNFITLVVLLFVGSGESFYSLFSILAVAAILLVGGVLSWVRFSYEIGEGELHIKQGVFVRKNLFLSSDRIQVIDITAGVVQRLFGLVEVEVKTAGSTSKEARISAISRKEAEKIKNLLRKTNREEPKADAESFTQEVYRLTSADLAIAASTSGSFGVALSIVGALFSQLDQIMSEEELFAFIETLIPSAVSTNMIFYSILFIVAVSWLLSFLGTFIKYYGFTLTKRQQELVIKYGLFEQKQLTVPFNRVQAIQIKEGLLRQPFGYATLILESAGYGNEQGNSTTLYPILPQRSVRSFLNEVLPDYGEEPEAVKPPRKALKRYLLRMIWVALAIIIPVWWFIPYGVFVWLLILPALLLGLGQYRDAMIGKMNHTLVIRSRFLSKTTAIVKKFRVQAAELSQNPFQRRLGLLSYQVTVASGNQGRRFKIRELNQETGREFLEWISSEVPEENSQTTNPQ